MNVKQAIEMLYKPDDMPIKITIGCQCCCTAGKPPGVQIAQIDN